MKRYPILSCPELVPNDEFETFKDETFISQKRNLFAPHLYQKKRNNKIVNIYSIFFVIKTNL